MVKDARNGLVFVTNFLVSFQDVLLKHLEKEWFYLVDILLNSFSLLWLFLQIWNNTLFNCFKQFSLNLVTIFSITDGILLVKDWEYDFWVICIALIFLIQMLDICNEQLANINQDKSIFKKISWRWLSLVTDILLINYFKLWDQVDNPNDSLQFISACLMHHQVLDFKLVPEVVIFVEYLQRHLEAVA